MMTVKLKVPAKHPSAVVHAGGQTFAVLDNHITVPDSIVAALEERGFTRVPEPVAAKVAPKPGPTPAAAPPKSPLK